MAKKTTITIETSSLLILQERIARRAWCPECGAEAEMVEVSSQEMSTLEPWIECRNVHRWQSPDGAALLCLNSLLALEQTISVGRSLPLLPKKERV